MKSPSQVNFLVAVPVLSILSIAYTEGTSRFAKTRKQPFPGWPFPSDCSCLLVYHPYVAVGLDVLNSILYFAGFIALGVFLSGLFFCHGTVCGAARADSVFAAVSWCVWTASATLAGLEVFRGARKPNPRTQAAFVETKDAANQA